MKSLEDQASRRRQRPALALVLAGSVVVVTLLVLARGVAAPTPASARAAGRAPATVSAAGGFDGVYGGRSVLRFADFAPDPGAVTTTTTTSPTTVPPTTTTVVVRVVHTASHTTTTSVRRPVTTTTAPRPPAPTNSQTGKATWYQAPAGSCAHLSLPIGTVITVTNLANGATATCTITGRGPYGGGGVIVDLDPTTFSKLAPLGTGVINVRITW